MSANPENYKKELAANGWEVTESGFMTTEEGQVGVFNVVKGARKGTVTFATTDEGTTISVNVYSE
ncbi:MAG: hypothetical protein QMD08_01130 [Actinomycetota bacterium]|nr:hypothetical protein [Actinomycetota bacterium]